MSSILLLDPQIYQALSIFQTAAPGGMSGLANLGDSTLALILTHVDETKIVWPNRFMVQLPNVDEGGYEVYDHTHTLSHRCVVDPNHPTLDLTIPQSRTMTFGVTTEDINFMWKQTHGDYFYIRYETGHTLPRTLLIVVMDPLVSIS